MAKRTVASAAKVATESIVGGDANGKRSAAGLRGDDDVVLLCRVSRNVVRASRDAVMLGFCTKRQTDRLIVSD